MAVFHFLAAPLFLFVLALVCMELVHWRHANSIAGMRRVWRDVSRLRHREDVRLLLKLRGEDGGDADTDVDTDAASAASAAALQR